MNGLWRISLYPIRLIFSHQFDMGSGNFEVKLVVDNGDPNCREIYLDTVYVKCPAEADFTPNKFKTIVGSNVAFSNTSINAATSSWYVDGLLESNNVDFNKSFSSNGKYKVTLVVQDPTGKCEDEKSVLIQVKCVAALFELSDSFPTPGSTITLTDLSEGATRSEWSINGNVIGSSASIQHTLSNSGVFTICIKVWNGQCEDEHCVKVFVFEEEKAECEKTYISVLGSEDSEFGYAVGVMDGNEVLISSNQDDQLGLTLLNDEGTLIWNRTIDPFLESEITREILNDGNGVALIAGYSNQNARMERSPFIIKI